jgi:hypothetical protein
MSTAHAGIQTKMQRETLEAAVKLIAGVGLRVVEARLSTYDTWVLTVEVPKHSE